MEKRSPKKPRKQYNVPGITNASLKRLGRKENITRISEQVYDKLRTNTDIFLTKLCLQSAQLANDRQDNMIRAEDVLFALGD